MSTRTALRRRPAVSVIMAAYNGRRTIARALDSIAAQTFSDSETIVVDDRSTDGTWELLRARGGAALLRTARNSGAGAARNLGLSRARGRFVAFLDQDDRWRPRFLETALAAFDEKTMVVSTNYDLIGDDGRVSLRRAIRPGAGLDPAVRALGLEHLPHHSSSILRREVFERVGTFDESFRLLCEDADLWYRAVLALGPGAFRFVDRSLACYRRSRPTLRAPTARKLRSWPRLPEKERARLFELARLLIKHDSWLSLAVAEGRA
jgi:glycosyltransferase involved in cell wall biosynthesis